jgi:hypothetical protein
LQFYATAGDDPSDNNNAGAGIQTNSVTQPWSVGSKFYVAMRVDANPNVTGMGLLMAVGQWPCEVDFKENGSAYIHWGAANSQKGFPFPAGADQTVWHIWGVEYLTTAINLTLDGKVWATLANPTTDPNDVHGLLRPVFCSLQIQDGDMSYPAAAIPQSSLVEMQVDWVAIDVPA